MTITYKDWVEDNRADLEELIGKDVIMAYSGGKDSSVVLHFLDQASKEFGFNLEAHGIIIPEHVLIDVEREKLDAFWTDRGVNISWHIVPEADKLLSEAPSKGISPCLICNQTKKKVLMDYFRQTRPDWGKLVMVISYSLWDLVSATVEHITGGIYADVEFSKAVRGKTPEDRFLEIAQRFYPILKLKSGLTIFKPLLYYNDQDIRETVEKHELPLTIPACNHKEYRPKRGFALYYHKMDHHFNYHKVLEFAQSSLKIPAATFYSEMTTEDYMEKAI